jgi:predicted aspartyl protease
MRGILAIAILAGTCAAAQAQDCGLKQFASIDLVGDVSRGPVVTVMIGGKALHLLVDTGGIYNTLSPAVVAALSLDSHELRNGDELYSASGAVSRRYVNAPDFQIGPIHLSSLDMIVAPVSGSADLDGTLAPDFLSRFDVDLDFGAKKMNLFSPEHCEGKVVYWAKAYTDMPFKIEGTAHIEISPDLDGHAVTANLDTGASVSILRERLAQSAFNLDADSPGMQHIPDAKPGLIAYHYRFHSLSFNGVEVRNPDIYMLPDAAEHAFEKAHDDEKALNDPVYGERLHETDAIIGTDVLTKLHLYISYKEKKLYFTAADAH